MKQPIEYIKECLDSVEESLIIEINARDGSVTRKLAEIPGSDVHAFEPLAESPIPNLPTNVQMNYCAITDKDSRMAMWKPTKGDRYAYNTTTTYEGSMPPSVTYRHMIEVPTRSLDSYLLHKQFTYIDLLWIDWYNAELTLLKNILPHTSNTSLIFVRWGNLIDVNGKPVSRKILDLLGDDWNILGLWDADILLYNCRFVTPKQS